MTDVGQTVRGPITILFPLLAVVGCGRSPESPVLLRSFVEVPEVGRFRLDQYDGGHSYVCERGSVPDLFFNVRIYPDRDEIDSQYADRIRRAVVMVKSRGPELVSAGMPELLRRIRAYDWELPEDVGSLARELVTEQLKIPERAELEMQFENRGHFRGLDVYAIVDDQGAL